MNDVLAAAAHCNEVLEAAGVPARAVPVDQWRILIYPLPDGLVPDGEPMPDSAPGALGRPEDAMWVAHRVAELHLGAKIWRQPQW